MAKTKKKTVEEGVSNILDIPALRTSDLPSLPSLEEAAKEEPAKVELPGWSEPMPATPLTQEERVELNRLENLVEQGERISLAALTEIRTKRLYREYGTWEEYCQLRWCKTRTALETIEKTLRRNEMLRQHGIEISQPEMNMLRPLADDPEEYIAALVNAQAEKVAKSDPRRKRNYYLKGAVQQQLAFLTRRGHYRPLPSFEDFLLLDKIGQTTQELVALAKRAGVEIVPHKFLPQRGEELAKLAKVLIPLVELGEKQKLDNEAGKAAIQKATKLAGVRGVLEALRKDNPALGIEWEYDAGPVKAAKVEAATETEAATEVQTEAKVEAATEVETEAKVTEAATEVETEAKVSLTLTVTDMPLAVYDTLAIGDTLPLRFDAHWFSGVVADMQPMEADKEDE